MFGGQENRNGARFGEAALAALLAISFALPVVTLAHVPKQAGVSQAARQLARKAVPPALRLPALDQFAESRRAARSAL